ncbi:hypothetical protein [Magnetospira sp. QH-2]|uniref:hypothetical protein n=1 Tax=Magnetospira sp. (strain QH-2) TaxID=1288970 RepID=UPI0003E8178A|nr:hypothetical protein [Magnetospira sp. QH-2]CCQ75278.1 conserved protein of unknown function [Magnetospira sp. QH-2]
MDEATDRLLRAGGESPLIEDFRAVAESTTPAGRLRHAPRPTLDWLSRFVVGQAGGPHKDAPLYELCHLVLALGGDGGRRAQVLLDPDGVTASRSRASFADHPGADEDGVTVEGDEGPFTIRFGRMPILAALYEFLCGMEGYGFYPQLEEILAGITGPADVRPAANQLSSHLRQYRKKNLPSARSEGKFTTIYGFLRDRSPENRLSIDDSAILDFWCLHCQGKEFRGYRAVFDQFTRFMESLEEAGARRAVDEAAPLGTDREAGELDPADTDQSDPGGPGWTSPLAAFDQPPLNEIKFLKGSSERKPMEALMDHGPHALHLPLAFLRYEVFGQVQAGITNDLQVGRGAEAVARRITCDEAESYGARMATVEKLAAHVDQLQKAALHVLASAPSPAIPANDEKIVPLEMAARAYKTLTRKGFTAAPDDDSRATFRQAAPALVAVGTLLRGYLSALTQLDGHGLDRHFQTDRETFSERFRALYGDPQ